MTYRPAFSLKTKAKPSRAEDTLQHELVEFHAHAVDQRHCILFAVPNGEVRDKVTAARLTGMSAIVRALLPDSTCLLPAGQGVLPGTCDLVLLLAEGRVVLVEVKRPKVVEALPLFPGKTQVVNDAGVLSKVQKRFRRGAVGLGHCYRVVHSLEEYADLLEEFAVPLRCRPWGPGVARPRPPVALLS